MLPLLRAGRVCARIPHPYQSESNRREQMSKLETWDFRRLRRGEGQGGTRAVASSSPARVRCWLSPHVKSRIASRTRLLNFLHGRLPPTKARRQHCSPFSPRAVPYYVYAIHEWLHRERSLDGQLRGYAALPRPQPIDARRPPRVLSDSAAGDDRHAFRHSTLAPASRMSLTAAALATPRYTTEVHLWRGGKGTCLRPASGFGRRFLVHPRACPCPSRLHGLCFSSSSCRWSLRR